MLLENAAFESSFHISLSERYLEHVCVTTARRTMHGRASLGAKLQVCLEFMQAFHYLNVTLEAHYVA